MSEHLIDLKIQGIPIYTIKGIVKKYAGSENFFGYVCHACGAKWGEDDNYPREAHYMYHAQHCPQREGK